MIFPDVRLSDLRRDVDTKRMSLDRSQQAFGQALRKKFSVINLIKDHPQLWMGAAMSLLSANRIGKVLGLFGVMKNGHANGSNGKKSGVVGKIFKFGGRTAVRTVLPLVFSGLKLAFKSAMKSVRHRRD